ncbi:MAG: lytic transglycosylase domain-containing protein [Burkholderiales bacterium]|nr:lytic transglycosylase domain-containing protein [Burkholderiales bacterium]
MILDVPYYIHQCVPYVAENTMLAIIKTESKFNPLAIGLNKGFRLMYQPQNLAQARSWATYLEKHGYNFDVGITQVNIKNIHKYGYSAIDALDPCLNMKLGGKILQSGYIKALRTSRNKQEALYKAISAYNTGNYHSGFRNGYVQKVVYNASGNRPYIPTDNGKS